MNSAIYGPLGLIIGAVITGALALWAQKISKKVTPQDLTKLGVDILEKATARADQERVVSDQKFKDCEKGLKAANARINNRDRATWEFLGKIDDHEDALYRIIDTLERIAATVMTREQHDAFEADMVIVRQQRVDVALAGKALKEVMYR